MSRQQADGSCSPTRRDRAAARPSLDLVAASVIVCGYVIVVQRYPALAALAQATSDQRLAIYAAGAGVMTLIAGFSGTAIAQYGSSSGPIVATLRRRHGASIRRNWLSIVRWLLASAVACIVGMTIDTPASPRFSDYIFAGALIIAVVKFCRLSFLFRLIMTAVDIGTDSAHETQSAYELGPGVRRESRGSDDRDPRVRLRGGR